MTQRILALLLVLGLAPHLRAQAASTGDQTMEQPDAADAVDTDPATQPTADMPTTQSTPLSTPVYRSATRPSRRRSRRGIARGSDGSSAAASTPQPRKLSSDFDVVMNRSIFLRGRQTTTGGGESSNSNALVSAPERSLVFNGVTKGDTAMAMLENTDTHQILKLRVGDAIARGKVVAISLNSLDYQADGVTTHIAFGQTLAGGTASGADRAPSIAGSTTQPASNLPSARQLGESMEAYLRRRHAMGL